MNQLVEEDLRPVAAKLGRHQLPPLTYGVDALQPGIDARTMTLHHDSHHGGYVEKLNAALDPFPALLARCCAAVYCALWPAQWLVV